MGSVLWLEYLNCLSSGNNFIMLLLTGEHYVWYRQDRIGYKNKKFKIWKFATMDLSKKDGGLPPDSVAQTTDQILEDSVKSVEKFHDKSRFSMPGMDAPA